MTFAYADPPYIGMAKTHYGPEAKEVNHAILIEYLQTFDAWALSLSSPTLQTILALCPSDVRVGAWVKPFCSFKPGVNPAYAWEPVIFHGGRKREREKATVRDWVSCNIELKRGVSGAKPETFCEWMFEFMGLQADDDFTDIFTGSGAVQRAFNVWHHRQTNLF